MLLGMANISLACGFASLLSGCRPSSPCRWRPRPASWATVTWTGRGQPGSEAGCSGRLRVDQTTSETARVLDAPLAATMPASTVTCTAPLEGLARLIVTVFVPPGLTRQG